MLSCLSIVSLCYVRSNYTFSIIAPKCFGILSKKKLCKKLIGIQLPPIEKYYVVKLSFLAQPVLLAALPDAFFLTIKSSAYSIHEE
jgi:hypothetical protein